MTETMQRLLAQEAEALTIPVPNEALIRARGRRFRTRRRISSGLAAAAVAACLALVGSATLPGLLADRVPRTTPASGWNAQVAEAAYERDGAFSVGSDIYFGTSADFVVHSEQKIKSFYYTSAGVVVRTGQKAYLDDAGPSNYMLVRPDGSTQRLPIVLGDVAPDSDPTQPYLAYVERGEASGWVLHVFDVDRSEEVANVPFTGGFTWGGWAAPPVALDGDHAYVGLDDGRLAIDWQAGTLGGMDDSGASTFPFIAGGKVLLQRELPQDSTGAWRTEITVRDVATGSVIFRQEAADAFAQLSPDGRFLSVSEFVMIDGPATDGRVIDLDDGSEQPFAIQEGRGWTPSGSLLYVTDAGVRTCDADTGACREFPRELGTGRIKVGGANYES